jgi:hypothetical protein
VPTGSQPTISDINRLREQLALIRQMQESFRERKDSLTSAVSANALGLYKPTLPEVVKYGGSQWAFHVSAAKERVLYGANRSGKTEAGIVELVWAITGEYPDWLMQYHYEHFGNLDLLLKPGVKNRHGLRGRLYAIDYERGHNEILLPKLYKYLPPDLRVEPYRNGQGNPIGINFPNGFMLGLMSYRQITQQSAGYDGDVLAFDEPPPKENLYYEAIRGTIDRGGRIWIQATPMDCDWLDDSIIDIATEDPLETGKPFVQHLDIRDNLNLPPLEVDWWVKRLPADQYSARVEGIPTSHKLKVYYGCVSRRGDGLGTVLPVEYRLPRLKNGEPDGWKLVMGIDPHDAQPPALLWAADFDPRLSGGTSRRVLIRSCMDPDMTTIKDAVAKIAHIEREELGTKAVMRVMDPNFGPKRNSITGQRIVDEYILEARRQGLGNWVVNTKISDDQIFGHEAVRRALTTILPDGAPALQVCFGVKEPIEALMKYRFKDESRKKVLDNRYKHWADLIRYLQVAPPSWGLFWQSDCGMRGGMTRTAAEQVVDEIAVQLNDEQDEPLTPETVTLWMLKHEYKNRQSRFLW